MQLKVKTFLQKKAYITQIAIPTSNHSIVGASTSSAIDSFAEAIRSLFAVNSIPSKEQLTGSACSKRHSFIFKCEGLLTNEYHVKIYKHSITCNDLHLAKLLRENI